jgi:integrase
MKHRWPRSIHCQIEAVFHCVRAFGQGKAENPQGIRSIGSWELYRKESHDFADFILKLGLTESILNTSTVAAAMYQYLEEKLFYYIEKRRSRHSYQTMLAALGKLEYAINSYIELHNLDVVPLNEKELRQEFYDLSKEFLRRMSRDYDSRAYPNPMILLEKISNGTFKLQAVLQYEGGFRCEGVGAPRSKNLRNPLIAQALRGIGPDPVSGLPVGHVASVEKGGKETVHYISVETYRLLDGYIHKYGKLESDYFRYLEAINQAARETGQYAPGRGTHGFKHNFAIERYMECAHHGLSHEEAMQQTSLELGHFRLNETLTYTRGHK